MKLKSLTLYTLIAVGAGFTAYAYRQNSLIEAETEQKSDTDKQEWFMLQSRVAQITLPTSPLFISLEGGVVDAAQITHGGARFVLYIDKGQ